MNPELVNHVCNHLAGVNRPNEKVGQKAPSVAQCSDVVSKLQDPDSFMLKGLKPTERNQTPNEMRTALHKIWEVKTVRLKDAMKSAIQWTLDPASYDSRWQWQPIANVSVIRTCMIGTSPLKVIDMKYQFGEPIPPALSSSAKESSREMSMKVKSFPGTIATHLSMIVQYMAVRSGIMSNPVSANIGYDYTFAGIEIRTTQLGCDPDDHMQALSLIHI